MFDEYDYIDFDFTVRKDTLLEKIIRKSKRTWFYFSEKVVRFLGIKYRLKIDTLYALKFYDKDYILTHACFQILVNYVEKERGGYSEYMQSVLELEKEMIMLDKNDSAINSYATQIKDEYKILDLYNWWKQDYRLAEYYGNTHMEEFSKKLDELILIKGRLWS